MEKSFSFPYQYFGQSLGETRAYAQSPLGGPVRFAEQWSDAAIECLAQLHTDLVIPLDPLDETAIAMDRVSAALRSQPAQNDDRKSAPDRHDVAA